MINFNKVKTQHIKVQEEIKNLDAKTQDAIKSIKLVIDRELDYNNRQYFDFSIDTFLMENHILGCDREQFIDEAKRCKKGKTFIFKTTLGSTAFYVTHTGEVLKANNYIFILEKSLINKKINQFTNLSFFDILKLTFKKLLGDLRGKKTSTKK